MQRKKVILFYNPQSGNGMFKNHLDYIIERYQDAGMRVIPIRAYGDAGLAEYLAGLDPATYQEEYASILDSMPDYAAQAGFTDDQGNGDLLAYVQDSYGAGATVESFQQYLYDSYYVTA